MALPSPLEKLIDTVEYNVKQDVEKYAPEHQSQIISRRRVVYKSRAYTPKSIDREICPFISLNGTCDNYRQYLDDVAENLIKKYAIALQESEERNWFDPKFNGVEYEKRINTVRKYSQIVASTIAGLTTLGGTVYLLGGSFDPNFSQAAYMIGTFTGLVALGLESWLHPFGRLFMIPYGKSKLLGTEQYKDKLKRDCFKDVRKHLRELDPKNPILIYTDKLSKICEN